MYRRNEGKACREVVVGVVVGLVAVGANDTCAAFCPC